MGFGLRLRLGLVQGRGQGFGLKSDGGRGWRGQRGRDRSENEGWLAGRGSFVLLLAAKEVLQELALLVRASGFLRRRISCGAVGNDQFFFESSSRICHG